LMACFLSSTTRWDKNTISPALDYTAIAKKQFLNIPYADMIIGVVPLMRECGIGVGLAPGLGMKGREWAYHVMQKLQVSDAKAYAMLHTHLAVNVFGLWEIRNGSAYCKNDKLKENFLVTSLATPAFDVSIFWTLDLPKDHRASYPVASPTQADCYQAVAESSMFRGGSNSAMGSLMLTIGSWGFPTKGRADLEQDLSIVLGIENNVCISGCDENQAPFFVSAANHYGFKYNLEFEVPKTRLTVKE